MSNKVKRPLSVWIAQILLAVLAIVVSFGAFMVFLSFIANPSLSGALVMGIELLVVALSVTALWGMGRRKSYGRWLGVGMLLLPLVFSVWVLPIEIQIILNVLILAVILHISFSGKAVTFFSHG